MWLAALQMLQTGQRSTYLSTLPQLLGSLFFGILLLSKFLARNLALVETGEVLLAGGRIEGDLGDGSGLASF